MATQIFDLLSQEYTRLSSQICSLENAIERLPEGSLEFNKNGNRYRHYQSINKKRTYLPLSEQETIEALAKKKYLQKMLMDARNEKSAIGKYLKAHNDKDHAHDLLTHNPHLEELLSPLFAPLDEKLRNWASADYPSTAGHPEFLIHPGPGGKKYRSKSEAMIAYILYKYRIPFRYEWDKDINGITYHIDFTIRHPKTGEFFYWEHCGMMDRDSYAANIGTKLRDFEKVGIFPDRNLILTFESRQYPFEIGMAEEIVKKWFL